MITIGIIGILAMTAIPKFGGMIRTAKDGDVRSQAGNYSIGVEYLFCR